MKVKHCGHYASEGVVCQQEHISGMECLVRWGKEQLMAGARWTSLMESVTNPRGPIIWGLFSILILI